MPIKDAQVLKQTKLENLKHVLDAPTKLFVLVELLNKKTLVNI